MGAASVTFILLCFAGCLSYGSSSRGVQRIIGGIVVHLQDAPYIVSLRRNGNFECGGSIISESWVVTAAHCFRGVDDPIGSTTVCNGSSYYRYCTIHTVDNVIIHEQFDIPVLYNNDIAVVHVTPPFNFNHGSLPIALPSPGESDARWGTICDWGNYLRYPNGTEIGSFSEQLQCAQIPLVNDCPTYLAKTDKMVCYGGYQQGGVSPCYSDSGGPLSFNMTLYGIISWGFDCGNSNLPTVYTRVTQFVGWIKSKTGIN